MPDDAGTGSDVGSPLAGAVAPGRLSDLGTAAPAGGSPARTMSDLGKPADRGAPPAKMQPLPELFGKPDEKPELVDETAIDPTAPVTEPETPAGELTVEQAAAKHKEWLDSDQIPEEFLDRPVWIDDGKGNQVPIRLRDIDKNVLLYNDYQKKTTEVAQVRRQNEAFTQGRQRWIEDMNSGDPDKGLRAMRAVGATQTLEKIVIKYIQNMAQLEGLPPQLQQQFMEGQQARDRAYFLEQQLEQHNQRLQAAQQEIEQQNAQQGANAPDVKYVQDSILQQLPNIYKQLRIVESPMIEQLLSTKLAAACEGVRDPQTGQWTTPPAIQLGRAPSRELLTQLVLSAKQEADGMMSRSQNRGLTPPPTRPLQGSGPAAKPGARGNISAPQQSRFSDLANSKPLR